MTNPGNSPLSAAEAEELMRSLLQKEGNWVDWGNICQSLQQGGYSSQTIFEETGFQGSQQNLVIVAAQVYESLLKAGLNREILDYFTGPRSDVLYEFRILNQEQRQAAAQLAYEKNLDQDAAHDVARAIQEFSRLRKLPGGFSTNPGDIVAYQAWRRARQKKDLQERSRLIAQGLKFAHTPEAREQIERLLSDFTVVPSRSAPLLPVYRLESEEELPRIISVAGVMPLAVTDLQAVPQLYQTGPFRVIKPGRNSSLVPVPGWQAILKAEDPVGIFANSDDLPNPLPSEQEQVLVILDRALQEWNVNSYFAFANQEGQVELQWFESEPKLEFLGQVILVLRPKNVLDENVITQPWQMDD